MGKYALTKREKKWLKERENRPAPCGDRQEDCRGCLFRFCILMPDYCDAAEFAERVVRCIAGNASELDMISNNLQFLDGFKAKSLAWYILREARLAVEEEMDE